MFKKLSCILSVLLLLLLIPIQVFAETVYTGNLVEIDKEDVESTQVLTSVVTEEMGSITITLEDTSKNLSKKGVTFVVVQVADIVNGEFVLKEAFESVDVDLNHIQTANELEAAAKLLQEIKTEEKIIITTDNAGIANATELPVGVYLLYAEDIADYDNITSSLISIPTFDEVEGTMVYDIEICPKHEPVPDETTILKTGIDDHILEYTVASMLLLLAAVVIPIYAYRKGKKSK